MQKIDFSAHSFQPVVALPPDYEVYDLTVGYDSLLRGTPPLLGVAVHSSTLHRNCFGRAKLA